MKSPYTLLQEELAGDPWKIFVCCIFCNLTKRRTSEPYFWEVLRRWPTPEKLSNADSDELSSLIEPLGLSQRRTKALKMMSLGYIKESWQDDPASACNHLVLGMTLDQKRQARGKSGGKSVPTWV